MMRMRISSVFLALVCALSAPALSVPALPLRAAAPAFAAEAPPEWEEGARILLDYQSFMRGDRDGGVRFSIAASRDRLGTPLAEMAVRLALLYDPADLSGITVGEAEARRILNTETELSPGHRDALRRFVARSFAAAGRREDAMQVHERRGLAMSWLVAGPFAGKPGADFSSSVLPEGGKFEEADAADPAENMPGPEQFAAWRLRPPWRRIPDNRSFPFVTPWRGTGSGEDGAMLLFTTLAMEATDNESAFHVHAETSWRLYVDGALLADVDRSNREAPLEHVVAYPLAPGRHTVMLQLFPPPPGADRAGARVALRLDSASAFSWDCAAAPPEPVRTVASRREPRPPRHLAELRDAATASPVLMGAYAMALLEQRMHDEAAWWAERAATRDPESPFLAGIAGVTTSLNPMLPPERRRDAAVAWHEKALRLRPDIVPSLLFLARVAMDEGRDADAAARLDAAYAVNPASLDVLMARGRRAELFDGHDAARKAWAECAEAFPLSSAAQLAVAGLPEPGFLNVERRLETCRAAFAAAPYVPRAGLMLASALADSGAVQEAQSVLRNVREIFEGDVGVLAGIAEIHARMEDHATAIKTLADALRITPDNSELWRRLGDFHMDAGEEEDAGRCWRASLAASPGQFDLADMLAAMEGGAADVLAEGGHDAIAMTARADAAGAGGDVVRLLDRSVVTFAPDGSYRRLTHEVDLARTRAGGERLAAIDDGAAPGAELLTARIVFPNGNTIEPEPAAGGGRLRLPVVMPGASREIRMLESVPAGEEPPAVAPWFFGDPEGRMAFVTSEYVVRAPVGFPLALSVNNLGRELDFEQTREGGYDVYRWTANLRLPGYEPGAAHVSERVPSVEAGMQTNWEDVVFHELRRFEGRLTPSMSMRGTLASLYSASPGERPNQLSAARAIYRFVCDAIDPAQDGRSGSTAAHIHEDRRGDRNILLLALLRAAGLDAAPAAARPATDRMHAPNWNLPDRSIFPVPMVRLTVPGETPLWLDTRFDSLPFGKVPDDLSGAAVLSYLPTGPLFETLPGLPPGDSVVRSERTVALPGAGDAAAGLRVSGRSLRRGVAGLVREREMANASASARQEMILDSLRPAFPDAVLEGFDVQKTDESEASVLERYAVSSAAALERRPDGTFAAPLCFLPTRIVPGETRNRARRRTVCHIREVSITEDRNVFVLPEGAELTGIPRAAHLPSRFGTYQLRVNRRGDGTLEIVRSCNIPAQRILPWDWGDFRAFLDSIDLAERQWVEYRVRD